MSVTDQDRILNAIADPGTAKILREILDQIEGEPLAAARMMRAFQGAKAIVTETIRDLPAIWGQLEEQLTKAELHRVAFLDDLKTFRSSTAAELAATVADLAKVTAFFDKLDDDKFLNKANRVLDVCERLQKCKKDGTLDWLKTLT